MTQISYSRTALSMYNHAEISKGKVQFLTMIPCQSVSEANENYEASLRHAKKGTVP